MAIAKKEKEKKKAGSKRSRKSYLQSVAAKGGGGGRGTRPRAQYLKFGDVSPSDVVEGTVSYRGTDYPDEVGTNVNLYARGAARTGKTYFRLQGDMYKLLNPYGTDFQRIPAT